MADPLEGEDLRRDVFPAEVLLPSGELLRRVRVLVTSHRLLIFRWVGEIDVQEYPLTESAPKNKATLPIGRKVEVEMSEGTAYVSRAPGCQCGPLGHMNSPVRW